MVWELCPYTRYEPLKRCEQCPQWEDDPQHGKVQRGCYMLAAEACRVVTAMERRQRETIFDDAYEVARTYLEGCSDVLAAKDYEINELAFLIREHTEKHRLVLQVMPDPAKPKTAPTAKAQG